jgi:hydrogenase nickel incorporation protein HypB
MCVVCGCGNTGAEGAQGAPAVNAATGDLHYGAGAARVSVPGMSAERAIRLEEDVLGENDRIAAANRAHFAAHGVTALNLVSSPGSGKTTLLVATIEALRRRLPGAQLAVIEGDQQTSHDADRIRATGAPAIQVNTGKGCHLDAPMVAAAFARLPLHAGTTGDSHPDPHTHGHPHQHLHEHEHEHVHAHVHAHEPAREHAHAHPHAADAIHAHAAPALLFIENVGNLVCPALWDLGEAAKVTILSVTEGEDKPLKYPDMFAASRLMVLNKTDLLPHLDFDVPRCIEYARRVNPAIEVLLVSAKSGQGMDAWVDWILETAHETAHQHAHAALHAQPAAAEPDGEAALRRRIAELEAQLAAARGQEMR